MHLAVVNQQPLASKEQKLTLNLDDYETVCICNPDVHLRPER